MTVSLKQEMNSSFVEHPSALLPVWTLTLTSPDFLICSCHTYSVCRGVCVLTVNIYHTTDLFLGGQCQRSITVSKLSWLFSIDLYCLVSCWCGIPSCLWSKLWLWCVRRCDWVGSHQCHKCRWKKASLMFFKVEYTSTSPYANNQSLCIPQKKF